jgi:maltose O-acetyltransferase
MNIKKGLSQIYRMFCPISTIEMYRRMGVSIGENTHLGANIIIDHSHYWHVTIGKNVGIGPETYILAHDSSTKPYLGYTKIANVVIEDNVFIGARAVILPGVTIGKNAIIGAGSVVSKNIPANTVWVGNPAKYVCTLQEYLVKQQNHFDISPKFTEDYTMRTKLSNEKKKELVSKIGNGYGFII